MKIFLSVVIIVTFFPEGCFGYAVHDFWRPISLHPSFNERKPVMTGPLHDQRKPVSLNQDHDQRRPVSVNHLHDQRKPVIPDGSHDLRWPVLEEDSHDSRVPVVNWFHLAMSHLFQPKPTPTTTDISQDQETTTENSENSNHLMKHSNNSTEHSTSLQVSTTSTSTTEDLSQICGISWGLGTTGRIVGGKKSEFQRWPWMISLRHLKWKGFVHKCGAVLLGRLWAVTAAHCVYRKPLSELQLGFSSFERSVKEVVIHPRYFPFLYYNDLALLRLFEPLLLDSDVTPVCLPPPQLPDVTGRWGVVTGWGKLSEGGEVPTSLHEVILPIISNAECEEMYAKAGHWERIPHHFVCAGDSSGGRDACEGDSGGPMVIRGDGGEWVMVGLTSWGVGCAAPLKPGVYIRISQYTDWINSIITH